MIRTETSKQERTIPTAMLPNALKRHAPRGVLLPSVQRRARRRTGVPGLIWDPIPPREQLDPIGLVEPGSHQRHGREG